ncbi:MAG: DUF4157 domain-containing protein, partial [Desulfatitalea sp.]
VRLHNDTAANEQAEQLGARAYASGDQIYFASNEYAPSSRKGRLLLAHELTHVLQQRSGVVRAAGLPATQCSPGMAQTLVFNRSYRYIGGSGAFASHDFEPDLRESIHDWLADSMTVFTIEDQHRVVSDILIDHLRSAHAGLGSAATLRNGAIYNYGARVRIVDGAVQVSRIRINGRQWQPSAQAARDEGQPVHLSPELESWFQALMGFIETGYRDGADEIRITFRRQPSQPMELVSLQRHTITPGTAALPQRVGPSAEFVRNFRALLWMAFGAAPQASDLWLIRVARQGLVWSVPFNGQVRNPPTAGRGDEVILDRRQLYGDIFRRWEATLIEAGVQIAGIAAEELIWYMVGGVFFRGLGAVLGRLPVLRRLISFRRFRSIGEGLEQLSRSEADDFARLLQRLERGETLTAAQTRRLEQVALRLEGLLAAGAPAHLGREEMAVFLQRTWRDNPILSRVANAQRLSGPAQQRQLVGILETFERETGVTIQVVDEGVVQAARGSGNFASLRSRPGFLQIERQVFQDTPQLMREVRHETAFYYSGTAGRTPRLGSEGPVSALELLEYMIEQFGALPSILLP